MDNINIMFTKQTVFVFNLLFGVTGISLVAGCLAIYSDYYQYHDFIGEHVWIAPFFLIAVGSIVFIITILCCYGTIRGNARMIQVVSNDMDKFLVLLAWIFFFELGTAVVVYVKRNQFNNTLDGSFDTMLKNHEKNKDAWTFAQTELKCCGVTSPKDWTEILNSTALPESCCQKHTVKMTATNCTEENVIKIGCKLVLTKYLEYLCIRLASIGFGIGWIQIVVVGYGCFLYNTFRSNFGQFTERLI